MSFLPEELWRRILEIGIESSGFSYKDLCCVSISCRRLHRLSSEDLIWNLLLSADYPQPHSSSSSSSKSLYKLRFERDKERRIAAHRRVVLRKESQIVEHSRRLKEIQTRVAQETATATQTAQDLSNLRRARWLQLQLRCQWRSYMDSVVGATILVADSFSTFWL